MLTLVNRRAVIFVILGALPILILATFAVALFLVKVGFISEPVFRRIFILALLAFIGAALANSASLLALGVPAMKNIRTGGTGVVYRRSSLETFFASRGRGF